MKQVKKTKCNGFYIFESRAAANSNYIENLREARELMVYANYFFSGYLKIYDYLITKDGWQMAIKVLSAEEIGFAHCFGNRSKPGDLKLEEIWRIISERVRLFIATYSRQTNLRRERTGSFVHSSYERFYFDSLYEAKAHLAKMRNQQLRMYQKKKKYRGLKTHYKIEKIIGKGSIFLCSKDVNSANRKISRISERQSLQDFTKLVVPELVKNTLILHQQLEKHPNCSRTSKNSP